MDQSAQKRSGRQHRRPAGHAAPVGEYDSLDAALHDVEPESLAFEERQIVLRRERGLHRAPIERAVGLSSRPADGRPLATVQHSKLNSARIGDATHEAIERVDLPDEMSLAEAADRRIAGQRSDLGKVLRQQRGTGAHPGRGRRSLAAGMAAADHDDIEGQRHGRAEQGCDESYRRGAAETEGPGGRGQRPDEKVCFT